MIKVPSLEWHVTHACNFSCDNCGDFSNYNHTEIIDLDTLISWYEPWYKRLIPGIVSIIGGEPLLNKDIINIIYTTKKYWNDPSTDYEILSNGWLLDRYPELPKALADTDCKLVISKHFNEGEYLKKFEEIVSTVEKWHVEYGIRYRIDDSYKEWRRLYKGQGADIEPFEDNDPEGSWNICPTYQDCFQLMEKAIYKCCLLAYLPLQKKKHGLSAKWDEYLKYQPLMPGCSDEDIIEFFNRKAEKYCSMCPSENFHNMEDLKFYHRDPTKKINFIKISR
jgi:hypothetical protein